MESKFTLVLLANEHTGDYALVELGVAIPPDAALAYRKRGLTLAGHMTLENGRPKTGLAFVLSDETMERAAMEFAERWLRSKTRRPTWN